MQRRRRLLENGTAFLASAVTGELVRSTVQQPDRWGLGAEEQPLWQASLLSLPLSLCVTSCRREHVAWLGVPGGVALHPDGYIVVCDMAKVGAAHVGGPCEGIPRRLVGSLLQSRHARRACWVWSPLPAPSRCWPAG